MTDFKVFSDGSTLPKMLTHSLLKQSECLSDIAGIAARTINLVNNRGADHLGNRGGSMVFNFLVFMITDVFALLLL